MTLTSALMQMKEERFVSSFEIIDDTKALVRLVNGKTLIAGMARDYIVGSAEIAEIVESGPIPEYVIYNNWDFVSASAYEEAGRLRIKIVSFAEFRRVLSRMLHGA